MPQHTSKNSINLILALVFGILWAFFWAVDQLVTYLLFGASSFFLGLYFYNRKIEADEKGYEKGTVNQANADREEARQTRIKTEPVSRQKDQSNQFAPWVGLAILLVALFSFLFNILWTEDSSETIVSNEEYMFSFYERAEQKYSVEEYDSAYFFYKEALREDPNRKEALLGLGNTLHMQHKTDSSLLIYQKAVELNPDFSTARYNIGWWYYNQKQYAEAIAHTKSLVRDEPENTSALQLIGDSFYEQSQFDSAFQWYEGAYTKGGRSHWLCYVLGYLYDRENNTDRAISLYKEALEYDTTVADIYVRLGELVPGQEGEQFRYRAAQLNIDQSK